MVLKYFWMGSPWSLNGLPMHFWMDFQLVLKRFPIDFERDSTGFWFDSRCLFMFLACYFFYCSLSPYVAGPWFSLILHCFSYFCYVLHCCVYDLGSVFIVLSTVVAYVRCLSFFVVSAVGWLFFFVRVLSVHVRRASGPPYFFIPCNLWDVV